MGPDQAEANLAEFLAWVTRNEGIVVDEVATSLVWSDPDSDSRHTIRVWIDPAILWKVLPDYLNAGRSLWRLPADSGNEGAWRALILALDERANDLPDSVESLTLTAEEGFVPTKT